MGVNQGAKEDAVVPRTGSLVHLSVNVTEVTVQMRYRLTNNKIMVMIK